jgi:endonuclease III
MDQIQEHRERMVQVQERLRKRFGTPTWHVELPAVDELVCTILSQNTNDINRDKAFEALKEATQAGKPCGMPTRRNCST